MATAVCRQRHIRRSAGCGCVAGWSSSSPTASPAGNDRTSARISSRPKPGCTSGLSGPFDLDRDADGGWVGHMEHQIDGLVVDGDHEVATLLARWEMIRNGASSRRQSIELMKEVVTSWT
ncbi:Scr1 family TA system antitoxin-like transcriptional regulator [Micromonospora sp. NPDC049175]|uniref:Scr1 family TA system antitoxin-like transcriptional regulator n=1 Tax=Micromonospora sp. NPDC049175 TaxID=3364266 RepID=UPI0037191F93